MKQYILKRYDEGYVLCNWCKIWIKPHEKHTETRKSKAGQLIHNECGRTVRQKKRYRKSNEKKLLKRI